MPIYEYECKQCHHKFEQLQKITEEPLHTCPECGQKKLTKLISHTSFQLKGTGWYVTDFKDKKPESKKPESEPTTSSNKESKKTEKPKENPKK